MATLLNQFEDDLDYNDRMKSDFHHEDTKAASAKFIGDVQKLVAVFSEDDKNPFAYAENHLINITPILL